MLYYLTIGYIAVILTGIAQIFLKKGSSIQNSAFSMYLNYYTISGYIIMLCVTLLNLYIYKFIDVKYGVILLPFTFIIVNLLSYIILQERLNKKQIFGSIIILTGVIIFNS